MTDTQKGGKRSRWQLLVLFLLFFGPLTAAWILYYGVEGWRPASSSNHGVLVSPPVPLPDPMIGLADGGEAGPGLLRKHWTLLYVDNGGCTEACQEALYRSRQVRTALGKESDRVRRLYLSSPGVSERLGLGDTHPDLVVADATSPGAREIVAAFPADQLPEPDNVYLVDPLGNLMMRFPLEDDARGMLLDLKKLLKLSRIG